MTEDFISIATGLEKLLDGLPHKREILVSEHSSCYYSNDSRGIWERSTPISLKAVLPLGVI